jgi:hypothetical protein
MAYRRRHRDSKALEGQTLLANTLKLNLAINGVLNAMG